MGFVGKNKVYSIEYNKSRIDRQMLKIKVNSTPQNCVLVIMKNPSTTCNNMSNGNQTITSYQQKSKCHIDRTTGKILRKLINKYEEIVILNLYSKYDSNPVCINNFYYSWKKRPSMLMVN